LRIEVDVWDCLANSILKSALHLMAEVIHNFLNFHLSHGASFVVMYFWTDNDRVERPTTLAAPRTDAAHGTQWPSRTRC